MDMDTGMGTIQQQEQFLENYNMIWQTGHLGAEGGGPRGGGGYVPLLNFQIFSLIIL